MTSSRGPLNHGDATRAALRPALLDSMLRPASVAIIGASGRKFAQANQALANLRAAGFPGEISVVHRTEPDIDGIATVRQIADLPRDIDVALVSVPAVGVLEALKQLEDTGCRSAVVPAAGLGSDDRQEIAAMRARGTMAVHGPNSFGLLNVTDNVPLVFWQGWLTREKPGNIGIIAQSGGAAVGVVKSTERARFSKIIASGNEWGVTSADYLAWLATDPSTDAVGLILESITDVDGFVEAVTLMRANDKRIVVLNVGRSAQGAALTSAHTSGLIGRAEGYAAFFGELDVPVASDYDEMTAILDAFSAVGSRPVRSGGIAVITESGGVAALTADVASSRHITLAALDERTRATLLEVLPGSLPLNPYDSGASPEWTGERFEAAINVLAADLNVSVLVAIADAQSTLTDEEVAHEVENFDAIAAGVRANPTTAVVVASTTSMTTHPRWRATLGDGVAVARGLSSGLVAAQALTMNRGEVSTRPRPRLSPRRAALAAAASEHVGQLPAALTRALLDEYSIPGAASTVAVTVDDAIAFASRIGFPVVVKIASPDIAHRSDIGAVITGIEDVDSLIGAIAAISARVTAHDPRARVDGFEIQEHVQSGLEAMIGFVADPVFGPIVTVGLGGVLVEILNDTAYALAPVSSERALQLISQTRLARIASGYRGLLAATSLDGLAECVANFSALAGDLRNELGAGELNPVLIREGSGHVCVVDSLLLTATQ